MRPHLTSTFLPQSPFFLSSLPVSPKPSPKPQFQPPTLSLTTNQGLQFRRKLLYLESLNINSLKALQQNPNLISTPLQTLKSIEKCLSSMAFPRSSLGRIFDMYPQLLTSDPHFDLYPIFEFLLNEAQIPYPDISRSIIRCPRLLVSSVDSQLRPNLMFLRKLGFVGNHKIDCNTTILLVSSVENTLIPKIEFLSSLGFSDLEVETMVVRSPALLTYSIEKNLVPKFEYFVREMKGDLKEIKRFPQYFSFSLEGRIKPRHRILLEHGFSMVLCDMLKPSDGEFDVRVLEMRLKLCDHEIVHKAPNNLFHMRLHIRTTKGLHHATEPCMKATYVSSSPCMSVHHTVHSRVLPHSAFTQSNNRL